MKKVKIVSVAAGIFLLVLSVASVVFATEPGDINRKVTKEDCLNPQGIKTGTHSGCEIGFSWWCVATTCAPPPAN